ncbi:MAG: helix-turn-helix domain-containing protein [Planctomycetota bacterium]
MRLGNRNSGRRLSEATIRAALKLVDAGVSQRKAAKLLGIHRDSVDKWVCARAKRAYRRRRVAAPKFLTADHAATPPEFGELYRCPGCGGRVQFPCLSCRTRGIEFRPVDLREKSADA